jgi:hypothetical protein
MKFKISLKGGEIMKSKKIKIEIKTFGGTVLFSYSAENNTIKNTLERAAGEHAYLRGADLRGADLIGACLTDADLRGADLIGACLTDADLRGADLIGACLTDADLTRAYLTRAYLTDADLTGADLTGAYLNIEDLPESFVNQSSRDMLFIFEHLKSELPFLREKLIKGEVNGSQYEGKCACLVGTLGNADGGVAKVCETIPYYDKGTHNLGEQWFLWINEGDTPENNQFAAHVLKLIDMVLGIKVKKVEKKEKGKKK